jgi:glycosyltransferase involved in cell wall biosynthesis
VTFLGRLEGTALAEAYRQADVFVFPSKTDTFGNVLLEALASGLPCAAFDVTGPKDILTTDPRLGAVDSDLGTAVRRALATPGTAAERHDYVASAYSWAKVARDFHRCCAELQP